MMEKINEKRLAVLKVALELLKVVQERQEIEIKPILMDNDVKELAVGEYLYNGLTTMDSITYTINHLRKPFEYSNLSEELEDLQKENIEIALDKILEIFEFIKKGELTTVGHFTDYTRVLWILRKDLRGN